MFLRGTLYRVDAGWLGKLHPQRHQSGRFNRRQADVGFIERDIVIVKLGHPTSTDSGMLRKPVSARQGPYTGPRSAESGREDRC